MADTCGMKALLIEDNPGDQALVRAYLDEARGLSATLDIAGCLSDGLKRLAKGGIDIVLLDLGLPDGPGMESLDKLRALAPDVPVVVFTGLGDEEAGLRALQKGAQDYVSKGSHITGTVLARILRYATERKKAEEAVRASEEKYRSIVEVANEGLWQVDSEERVAFANGRMSEMLGYAPEEMVGKPVTLFMDEETRRAYPARLEERRRGKPGSHDARLVRKDGSVVDVSVSAAPVTDGNGLYKGRVSVFTDLTERKQAELKYETILQTAVDGFFVADTKGCFKEVNDAYCRMVGYSRGELLRMTIADVEAGGTPEIVTSHIRHIMETGTDRFETLQRARDGHVLDVEASVTYLRDRDMFFAFMHDITDRVQAEATLRENQSRLLMAQRAAHIGNWDWDLISNKVYWADENYRILGLDPQRVSPSFQALIETVVPEERDFVQATVRDAIDNRKSFDIDFGIVRPDGEWRIVNARGRILSHATGTAMSLYGTVQDVSERAWAERALLEAEAKWHSLVDQAPDQVMLLDTDGNIILVNHALPELNGKPAIGTSFYGYSLPKQRAIARRCLSEAAQTGKPQSWESAYKSKAGGLQHFESHVGPLTLDGRVVGLIVRSTDVTRRKEMENELARSREELRNLSVHLQRAIEEEKARIARDLHDDLGQVLTGLKLDLSWVARRLPDEAPLRSKAQSMLGSLDQAVQQVRRIATQLRPGLLDDLGLVAAMEWQGGQFRERTGARCDFSLRIDDEGLDPEIATAVFRIFQEALTNISRHAQATRVRVTLREHAGALRLVVRDDGVGFDAQQLSGAKGFGLIGMRERAQSLGGEIKISAATGKWSMVTAIIPRTRKEQGRC